ncbi:XRE family transcriptional regulator [Mycolicibacterium sp.]|uniref:XRE family transcriptional regulator n=1 Tax=Mycolicibacterium sp. TaxID=2320850 RepID=UPI0037CB1D09
MAATTRLGALIDRYKHAHGVADAELARRIGVTRAGLIKWRTEQLRQLPDRANLAAIARVTGQPYRYVLSAALFDSGYLTEVDPAEPRPYAEVLHDAIAVLTEAARLTNQPMRQSNSGEWEPNPDPRAALPIDWAEFVTHALAGAAANIGGVEQILAGRAGSWEAEVVRRALQATVGADDEYLLQHRTEPVLIDLWVESILQYTSDTAYDDYRAAEQELWERENAIPEPDDLPPGPFSADDPRIAAVDWISVDEHGYLVIGSKAGWGGDPADIALLTELTEEARNSRDPTPGEVAYDQAHEALSDLSDALAAQERRENQDYADNLTRAIEAHLATLELPTPVTVTVSLAPDGTLGSDAYDDHAPPPYPRNAIEQAIERAIATTPTPSDLPGTPLERLANNGIAPAAPQTEGDDA